MIRLVDTSGFEDIDLEDGTTLERIADWLQESYEKNMLLTGLIFMHNIHEARVGRSSRKNMTLFPKFSGHDNMRNVVLLTNKWDPLSDPPWVTNEKRTSKINVNFGQAC